jgi:hypothetical protein
MTDTPFNRLFERFNAPQIRADRAADRIYGWSLIAGLAFAALCIAVVLTMGVE